ncbi:MAG TPA: c-type cytochrome [Gemmatimonadaceae bacterium]
MPPARTFAQEAVSVLHPALPVRGCPVIDAFGIVCSSAGFRLTTICHCFDAEMITRRVTGRNALPRSVLSALLAGLTGLTAACRPSEPKGDDVVSPEPVAYRVPAESEVSDSVVLASIRRGRALLANTRDSLPDFVGNRLQCVHCHPDNGTRPNVMPWVGVYARFPQYRSRAGGIQIIEDRINDCMLRSMNGRPLVTESSDMRDIVAYMAFLSIGYPVFSTVDGQSFPRLDPLDADTVRGAATFAAKCAVCHGPDGEGTDLYPALWGPGSFNIGAGMARVRTAAAFIKVAMPQTAPGTLTDQEAYDLAALITSRPRPDFPGKERDWPNGDPPPDVAYPVVSKPIK